MVTEPEQLHATQQKYEIIIDGLLDQHWATWLHTLQMDHIDEHRTRLTGYLRDQAALFGVLQKLHNMGLLLVSVRRIED